MTEKGVSAYGGALEASRLRLLHASAELGDQMIRQILENETKEQAGCGHTGYKVCFDCGKILP